MAFLMEMAEDELVANYEEQKELWIRIVQTTGTCEHGTCEIEEGSEEFRWIP
jgi:hypothetical protein